MVRWEKSQPIFVANYKHLFQLGTQNDESIRLSNHHLTLIDQLLQDSDTFEADVVMRERLDRLKNFKRIEEQKMPASFQGQLRPYQQAGFEWLHFLNQFNFGGCLADDMGLGKTVQVLGFFAVAARERDKPTS